MKAHTLALLACLAPAIPVHAYCIQNDLKGRDVHVVQELHPSGLREKRTLDVLLKPGEKECCNPKNLDCNPEGKVISTVGLEITIAGEPAYACGIPERGGAMVKVTGGGAVTVTSNPKTSSANPYIVRVRTQDRDVTGPSGLACTEQKPKAK
jgi:hypothetical protein